MFLFFCKDTNNIQNSRHIFHQRQYHYIEPRKKDGRRDTEECVAMGEYKCVFRLIVFSSAEYRIYHRSNW